MQGGGQDLTHIPHQSPDFGFWILDFGVQFDKLTVRAVTEPVEVQSNDFGFWILKALPIGSFRNSNVSSLSPNGITKSSSGALALSEAIALAQRNQV